MIFDLQRIPHLNWVFYAVTSPWQGEANSENWPVVLELEFTHRRKRFPPQRLTSSSARFIHLCRRMPPLASSVANKIVIAMRRPAIRPSILAERRFGATIAAARSGCFI
jgi:hypothetical protein